MLEFEYAAVLRDRIIELRGRKVKVVWKASVRKESTRDKAKRDVRQRAALPPLESASLPELVQKPR